MEERGGGATLSAKNARKGGQMLVKKD